MRTHAKKHPRFLAAAAAGLLCITLIAWNHKPDHQPDNKQDHNYNNYNYQDTLPGQRPKTPEQRDLDSELKKLDQAIERLEHLKSSEWDHIPEKVQEQLKRINIEEMAEQAELAMKAVDLNKINIEARKALKAIDVESIQKQVDEAMADVKIDNEAIQKAMSEVNIARNKELAEMKDIKIEELNDLNIEELQDLNTEKMDDAMDEVKAGLEKAKTGLKIENKDLKKELDKAKTGIEEAKKEIRGYQDMIYSMEKEGLLDTNNDYKIANVDGSIYINNKKQTDAVSAKYGKYLKKNITINKKNGSFTIGNNQPKAD